MAFALKTNTNLGVPATVSPSGKLASAANYIDPYSYAMQWAPDQLAKIHLQKGKGSIMKFCQLTGSEEDFSSDQVIHTELGDLHEALEAVTVSGGDTFTTNGGAAHNLRVRDKILISDGVIEKQAVVTSITSSSVFVAKNIDTGAFGFTNTNAGPVTVMLFTNVWGKGEGNFTQGREDSAQYFTNYPHTFKEFYSVNESDMAHNVWIETPQFPGGEGWYNLEIDRSMTKFDNLCELTHLLNRRATAASDATGEGLARGMKGVIQQVEDYGNISNEYITDIEELSAIAFRIKQQGGATAYTVWVDHGQMANVRKMLADVNSHYSSGANYGIFQNSREMALSLDFNSVKIDGITFHFTPYTVLDDPQLLGSAMFKNTAPAFVMIPAGEKSVLDQNGDTYNSPFLKLRYRRKGRINRYKKVEFFGGEIGTPHKTDTMEMHVKTEQTNQVIGANQWFIGRRGTGIYTGS